MSQQTNTPEDIKPFTVRFPRPLNQRLGRLAVDQETTKQAIVQEAVEAHLDRAETEHDIKGKR